LEFVNNKKNLELKDIVNDSNFTEFYNPEVIKNNENIINKSLDSTPQELIDAGFTEIENQIKNELLEKLKNNVGVQVVETYEVKKIDEDFFELNY
jgi:restriction system protein